MLHHSTFRKKRDSSSHRLDRLCIRTNTAARLIPAQSANNGDGAFVGVGTGVWVGSSVCGAVGTRSIITSVVFPPVMVIGLTASLYPFIRRVRVWSPGGTDGRVRGVIPLNRLSRNRALMLLPV